MAKRKDDNEDQNQSNQADDSADNFGLPNIEYKPLDRTEPVVPEPIHEEPEQRTVFNSEEPVEEPVSYVEDEEESASKAPVIIAVIIAFVVAAAGFTIWKYWYVPRVEKQKMEQARLADAARLKKEEADRIAKEQEAAEQKRLADEAAAKATPPEGTIETLSARTNRFYVVLASDIDDDLIMDYAKRLSAKGVSTKIVPAFGTAKFFRLAMSTDYDSYAAAQSGADAAKTDYGSTLWVIKY
jgi:hypothetical protein